jgi:hypothetical protein
MGYQDRKISSNMGTRTKPGHQIWLPEQIDFIDSYSLDGLTDVFISIYADVKGGHLWP